MAACTVLAADIGGVNARLGAFTLDEGRLELRQSLWLASASFATETHLFKAALEGGFALGPGQADIVSLAVAGPVTDGTHAKLTNASMRFDMPALQARYGCRHTLLMNDFIAQAYASLNPENQDKQPLHGPQKAQHTHKTRAIIGAGTGFGVALLVPHKGAWLPVPTEYAQSPFAFIGEKENAFAFFAATKLGQKYVRVDDVLSGRGLILLHQFLSGEILEPGDISHRYLQTQSPTLCFFARLYARVARSLALMSLCEGGLYITGGLAAKNPLILNCPDFKQEFYNTLAYHDVLANIPVRLMDNPENGLWGAARAAAVFLEAGRGRDDEERGAAPHPAGA